MDTEQPFQFPGGKPRPTRPSLINPLAGALSLAWLLLILLIGIPAFIWFGCRIEPGSDQIAVLIRKTGADLPDGQILATEPGQKGIQEAVLPEGRYFRNPYTWGWIIRQITDVPAGKLGVITRLHGANPPPGQILAGPDTKGIVADILRPGKYRINPYAEQVELFDALTIRPGHIGVVTTLTGEDMLTTATPPAGDSQFLVGPGLKGVRQEVLEPGTYYLNPYMINVIELNLQSQRFEMSGADAISFLTHDGFTVTVEGTIEFAIERDRAAQAMHRVGDLDDIIKKVILPRARGFSRIEGSKQPAIDFIVGETRQAFQKNLEAHLRAKSVEWGVDIKSVLIRKITVPDEIARISRAREIAVQDARKYEQQIEQARSRAELGRQEMLAQQNREKVEAETERIRAVINAQEKLAVRVIAAEKELEVATVDNEAADFRAQAILSQAAGEQDAVRARNAAEVAVLSSEVAALGGGMGLARYLYYDRIGPRIKSWLTSDRDQGLGSIFGAFVPPTGEIQP
ncbi:MAG: hypothetical protein K9N49_06245 [Candidatus Marinimicrobia bacterium]|nr:hypothetical protein [Candidatus Neomarinimicrobiota bacterium]